MNHRLLRYYKKKLYGGKSIIARIIDLLFFRAVLLLVLFIIFIYLSRSLTVALLISIFITAALSLVITIYKRKKVVSFMKKDILRVKQKCLLETLTFMSKDEYKNYINKMFDNALENIEYVGDGFTAQYEKKRMYVFHNHPSSKCEAAAILSVFRLFKKRCGIIIISLSKFSEDAKKMCVNLPVGIELISGEQMLRIASEKGLMPSEEIAQGNAKKEMDETLVTFEKFKKTAFSRVKIKGYIICGIAIMCWPLFSGFRFYYPIIAIVCFALAIFTYRKNKQGKESKGFGTS